MKIIYCLFSALALILMEAPFIRAVAVGTTGPEELKIPMGVRPIAMGQSFVAVADDANAISWNPAGLRSLGGTHLTAQYDVFIDTVSYNYFAGAAKLSKEIGVGLSGVLLSSGPGAIYSNYMNINLAGALKLDYHFDVGLTAKFISKDLSGTSASTFAFDLGAIYTTPIPHLRAGLNIQNVGLPMKFIAQPDPLPFNVKIGAAYKMFEDDFTVALDVNVPNDNAVAVSLGGEYWYKDVLVGRFGYRFQGEFNLNQTGGNDLYLGAGVKIKAFGHFVGLDYAWTDVGFFGANHHFALDVYL